MKAAVYQRYGAPDVLELREVPAPVPKDGEILVRVRASTVSSGDARLRAFNVPPLYWLPARLMLGIRRPKNPVLGMDFAGEVEAAGKAVARFKPGDAVFGIRAFGSHAECKCVAETAAVAPMPAGLGFAEAAALPFGGLTALHFLRQAKVGPGQRVLVYGASGAVGTAAVQIARHFGAEVTAVTSAANFELARSLGAAAVIDYTRSDFSRNGQVYEAIFDTVGKLAPSRCQGSLKPGGFFLAAVTGTAELAQKLRNAILGGPRVIGGESPETVEGLAFLSGMVEAGAFRPVIDRNYPLERIAEAHAYVDTGRKKGSVVVTMPG